MTKSSLALLSMGFWLLAPCSAAAGATMADAAPKKGAATAAKGQVSGFADPALTGLAVRDHPQGAQVVTSPTGCGDGPRSLGDPPEPVSCVTFRQCMVLSNVNGTPVQNAAQFRETMNGVYQRKEEFFIAWSKEECP